MNWFDLVLLAILLTCALTGVKIGLIRAGFMAGGVLMGWLVAAQYSGEIGDLLGNSLSNHTAITVVSYSIIIVVSVLISPKVAKLVKPLLTFLTLGLSSLMDRVGGLLLGIVIGVGVCGALILGAARVTYDFEISDITDTVPAFSQVNNQIYHVVNIGESIASITDVKANVETILSESVIVLVFINITSFLPNNALGFVPDDFGVALELLGENHK